ncbi:DUF349 domain-containing protein [Flocculibacter collagenilyticus]|uniref:DUF349 domain-containing protein n=1 Tax=Flocculibacter collagenilyticus TaxID=2744479 RepID=UPI0018F6C466|nr:DUF349 domain-containing protein [Flocculibacter collagenilyticus]
MIFKSLFQPKWKHKNADIRIKAIETLVVDNLNDKSVLHELAFNDADEKVRLAALEHLNDFSLWWQANKKEKSERLVRITDEKIKYTLLGKSDCKIDSQLKKQFVNECTKSALLETLALQDADEEIRVTVLAKLNKESLYINALIAGNLSTQSALLLLEKIQEPDNLNKIAKKLTGEVQQKAQHRLDAMEQAKQKPIAAQKSAKIILSKLNALKDKSEYIEIDQKRADLIKQWQALTADFTCLEPTQAEELQTKYNSIITSLDRITTPLKTKWEAQQQAEQDRITKLNNAKVIEAEIAAVEIDITNLLQRDDDTEEELAAVATTLANIQSNAETLLLMADDKLKALKQLEILTKQLSHIPECKHALKQAALLLEVLSTKTPPTTMEAFNELGNTYQEWQRSWRNNLKSVDIKLSDELKSAHQTLTKEWNDAIAPLKAEQTKRFNHTQKKLSELKRLIFAGKYRAAFGLYKKVASWYNELNEQQQSKLEREYTLVKEKIDELEDWQEYIATPRKQEMVAEVAQLAVEPLSSPQEQASRIKYMRSVWNTLGKATPELNEELNAAFDQACENAFAICRAYYAEQEKIRTENLIAKQTICAELALMNESTKHQEIDYKQLDADLKRISQQWKGIGLVDKDQVKQINQTYYDSVNALRAVLNSHYQNNADKKQALVQQAITLAEQDDLSNAAAELKQLQAQWKEIGFAGRKLDRPLWAEFREVNDGFFAKRKSEYQLQKNENAQVVNEFDKALLALTNDIESAENAATLNKLIDDIKSLLSTTNELPKAEFVKLAKRAETSISVANSKIESIAKHKTTEQYAALFNVLRKDEVVDSDEAMTTLPNNWQQALSSTSNNAESRHHTMLKMEITAGVDSPEEDNQARMAIQIDMLSSKLSSGSVDKIEHLLLEWLSFGLPNKDEQSLVSRLEKVLIG